MVLMRCTMIRAILLLVYVSYGLASLVWKRRIAVGRLVVDLVHIAPMERIRSRCNTSYSTYTHIFPL